MIKFKSDKCTGCRRCEVICSMTHEKRVDPYRRRIRVTSEWPWKEEVNVCKMCKNPKCVESCKPGALEKTEHGHISLNSELCNGCFACVSACPFGAVWKDEERKVPVLCDSCSKQYSCVKWCPEKALVEVE